MGMTFDKALMFLGAKSQVIQQGDLKGRTMYNVQVFDQDDNAAVGLNVCIMDNNADMADKIEALSFGRLCMATFELAADQGKYRLRLRNLLEM